MSSGELYSHCISIFMTLCYFNIIIFLVCSSCILDIVMINDEFMHMFAKRLAQYSSDLSGQHYVSMVLKYYLLADAFYTLGHVVDCGCDTPVESFVVHSPFVEQVEPGCEGSQSLFHPYLPSGMTPTYLFLS